MVFEPSTALGEQIVCFTTSIYGGVSKHNYFSLNLGAHVGDNQLFVDKNRSLVATTLATKASLFAKNINANAIKPVKWLDQQHTNVVLDYSSIEETPCDGIYTDTTNTPLAIMTADCMPIVVYCSLTNKLLALHAGWRGLLDGVIEAGLTVFTKTKHLKVWIGPSICAFHFEVSLDVLPYFAKYQTQVKPSVSDGKWKVDLPSIAKQILNEAGVQDIQMAQHCTYQNKDCFSHRRAGKTGFKDTGRMATIVMRVQSEYEKLNTNLA